MSFMFEQHIAQVPPTPATAAATGGKDGFGFQTSVPI